MKNTVQDQNGSRVVAEKADKRFYYIGMLILTSISISTIILVLVFLSNTLEKYF